MFLDVTVLRLTKQSVLFVLTILFIMRVVLQRVLSASVTVQGRLVSKIGKGILCLVGIRDNDDAACSEVLAKKILVCF